MLEREVYVQKNKAVAGGEFDFLTAKKFEKKFMGQLLEGLLANESSWRALHKPRFEPPGLVRGQSKKSFD